MFKYIKILIKIYIFGLFFISFSALCQKNDAEKILSEQKLENLSKDQPKRDLSKIKKLKAEIKNLEAQYKSIKNKKTSDRKKKSKLAKTIEGKKSQLAKLELHQTINHVTDKFGDSYSPKANKAFESYVDAGCYTGLPGKIINADFQNGMINSGESLLKRGFTWVSFSEEVKKIINKYFSEYIQGTVHLNVVKERISFVLNKAKHDQAIRDISSVLRKTLRQLFPGKKISSSQIEYSNISIREVKGESSLASFPVVHNDFIAAPALLENYEKLKDKGWQMINIWVALKDIKSHPLAMVTNPNWQNYQPPKGFIENSLKEKSRMLCDNTEYLNYIIRDMKAYDAIIFLTKDVFHTAVTAGDMSEARASFEFRSFIKIK